MAKTSADLLPGTLDMLILKAVSLKPLHGYGVLLRIADFQGCPGRATGIAVSGAVSARAPGLDRRGMGRERQQAAREVLHPDPGRAKTSSGRDGELEPARRCHLVVA
jgi:hypothetical protein